jgi:hypothetical protein
MNCQEPLQALRKELLLRGLPRDYVERVTGELADHADDVAAETGAAAPTAATLATPPPMGRLGDPLRLADAISRAFQRRTFLGRHPWLTFVALPAAAMIAAWFATGMSMVLVVELVLALTSAPWAAAVVSGTMAFGLTYGMPMLLCWWAFRKARQTTHAWGWAWAATTVLVLTSFVFRIYVIRMDNGGFGIDIPLILRWACAYVFFGEDLPFWNGIRAESLSFGYLGQVAVLIGATAYAIRRTRRALVSLVTTEVIEHAER